MSSDEKVNILLVDDQPAKLLSYEVILREIGENLIQASSGRAALEHLLKTDIAVVLMDVCMPELDGFELAAMIRNHPRFRKTAIIFVSAIQATRSARSTMFRFRSFRRCCVPKSGFLPNYTGNRGSWSSSMPNSNSESVSGRLSWNARPDA